MNSYINKIKNFGKEDNSSGEYNRNIVSSEEGEIYLLDEKKSNIIINKFDTPVNTDEIAMPNAFIDIVLGTSTIKKKSPKVNLLEMPVAAINIFFRTIALVKSSQFNAEARPQQLELFRDEYKTKENSKVLMSVNIKDISFSVTSDGRVKGRREKVREAIDFLQNSFYVWVIGKNKEGIITDYKLSFIENPSFTKGKVTFEMNIFWFEQLININYYNNTLLELPNLLGNTRHVLFSLYLERFDLNKWKPWSYKNINELFSLNYSDASSLAKGFLRDIRHKLDKNSLKSFQYKVNGDNILIMPYQMKKIANDTGVVLSTHTLEKLDDSIFVNYISRRHNLSQQKKQSILDIIKNDNGDKILLKNSYNEFKKYCRKEKKKVVEFEDQDFINKWNSFIFEEYKQSEKFKVFANGFPKI